MNYFNFIEIGELQRKGNRRGAMGDGREDKIKYQRSMGGVDEISKKPLKRKSKSIVHSIITNRGEVDIKLNNEKHFFFRLRRYNKSNLFRFHRRVNISDRCMTSSTNKKKYQHI